MKRDYIEPKEILELKKMRNDITNHYSVVILNHSMFYFSVLQITTLLIIKGKR